ncbi:MAG: hypothetical protein C5B50_06130 [Verrucomicrobia bacterium]|nr:MAG: hypothetical protein C5B50_06130 [Verrucomicrobiota bacterium]
MRTKNIENTIVDEANHCTYVILAERVLTDGEIYRAIRQEILRRGSRLAEGETLTLTITSSGKSIASVSEPQSQKEAPSPVVPDSNKEDPSTSQIGSLG